MDKRELRCPRCGGKVEERGSVRYYGRGTAYVAIDGHREFVTETWTTPIGTLEVDDLPFHCVDCDEQHELDGLVPAPFPSRLIRDHRFVHVALGPAHLTTMCGMRVGGYWHLEDHATVTCPECVVVAGSDSPAIQVPGRTDPCPS